MVIKEISKSVKSVSVKIRFVKAQKKRVGFLRHIAKMLVVLLLFSLNWIGFLGVGQTVAYYYDTEISEGNFFSGSMLDFKVDPRGRMKGKVNYGSFYQDPILVFEPEHGIDWKYRVRIEKIEGLDDFCNTIFMELFYEDDLVYSGDLYSFVSGDYVFSPPKDNWKVIAKLLADEQPYLTGESCKFDFVYEGWQGELPVFPNGFSDVERARYDIIAGSAPIVINEFLPNPIGPDDAAKPGGEWVELYNKSTNDFDVAGWYLYDKDNAHPLPITAANSDNNGGFLDSGETVVPGHGFLVVYLNGAYTPEWLNNTGSEKIRLFDGPAGTGNLADSYQYSGAPENKSFARIPDGTGDFVDPIPTPLAPNIAEEPMILTTPEAIELNAITSEATEPNIVGLTANEEPLSLAGPLIAIVPMQGETPESLSISETEVMVPVNETESEIIADTMEDNALSQVQMSSDEVSLGTPELPGTLEAVLPDEQPLAQVQEIIDEGQKTVAEANTSLPEEIVVLETVQDEVPLNPELSPTLLPNDTSSLPEDQTDKIIEPVLGPVVDVSMTKPEDVAVVEEPSLPTVPEE